MANPTLPTDKSKRVDLKGLYIKCAGLVDASNNVLRTTQGANIAPVAITFSTGDPSITPNSAVTIANGATPTVNELLEYCEELNAKLNTVITALEDAGVLADS